MKNHPGLKGIDLINTGRPERAPLMVTKTRLFSADGPGLFNAGAGGGRGCPGQLVALAVP